MSHIVAVTGASGNIGRELVRRLFLKNVRVRVIGRNHEKLSSFVSQGAEERVGNLQDAAFLTDAFRGADAVFAMIPEHPFLPDFIADKRRTAASLAEAIGSARVARVVAVSAIGVSPPSGIGPAAPHGELEALLKSIPGLSAVALRPAFLMENHMGSIPFVRNAGVNGSAILAHVPVAMTCTRDIASIASEYLVKPDFKGFTIRELLGPRDYTLRETTTILGAAINKPELPYIELPYEGLHKGLVDAGFSPNAADSLVELQKAFNEGLIRSAVPRNQLNTTPTSLEDFAREVFAPAYRSA